MQNRINQELDSHGHSFVPAANFTVVNATQTDIDELATEWNNLEADDYLKGNARFRERRFGRFGYLPHHRQLKQLHHRAYYQAPNTNQYAGGVHRVVAPLRERFATSPVLADLIKKDFDCFPTSQFDPRDWWYVACHLFRIIGRVDELGEPTPEGVHRDDINFGAMHLMNRENAIGGVSRIHEQDHTVKAEICLQDRMDTLYWADNAVLHSVTPIVPANEKQGHAFRDILILGYTHNPNLLEEEQEVPH